MNGRIVDPESGWDGPGSIGVTDGKIAAISREPLSAKRTIDASGLCVTPGFIDLHALTFKPDHSLGADHQSPH